MSDIDSAAPPARTIEVFFAYSHKDEVLRDELEKHLSILNRSGIISGWHDRRISGGNEWDGKIDEYLNRADIILLLVSADFISSNYCYEVEMKRAIERHDRGEARVIPVIIRHCDWEGAPFSKLQGFPKDMKPVTSWASQDEAFKDVAVGIRRVAEELRRTPRKLPTARIDAGRPPVELTPGRSRQPRRPVGPRPLKWRPTPGKLVLQGPHIGIQISRTRLEMEAGRAVGVDFPALCVRALIDTGASLTVINPQIAMTCKLRQTEWIRIATAGAGGGDYAGYGAEISFPGTDLPRLDVVRVVACSIIGQPFSCLIGRDVLRNWLLTYDGLNGELEIRVR